MAAAAALMMRKVVAASVDLKLLEMGMYLCELLGAKS
jgi:hypothetical protein